jgi:DNA-binding phage protein
MQGEKMTTDGYAPYRSPSFAAQLAENVKAALRYAGPADAVGVAKPLRSVALQKRSGIARSTLRTLKDSRSQTGPNPDLHTLSRLADALGLPLAFLMMRPEDWETLCKAINDMRDPIAAAEKLIPNTTFPVPPCIPERVLRECRLQPDPVPYGLTAGHAERTRVEERNEQRRRGSHVLGSLMLRGTTHHNTKVLLTALAATLAHQLSYEVPGYPGISIGNQNDTKDDPHPRP